MDFTDLIANAGLEHIVKDVCVIENKEDVEDTSLPFYADGFPGLMFRQSDHPAVLSPVGKELSEFFIYGQTLNPIEILLTGRYKLICFQLYPISVKALFNIDTKNLNNHCYDLHLADKDLAVETLRSLKESIDTGLQVKTIADYIKVMIGKPCCMPDERINSAVSLVLNNRGDITIAAITEKLNITERTLQRLFIKHLGISPKQFCKIIRFQASVNLLNEKEYSKLTDIVFETGFADQSHFIRNFKKFTGLKPSNYKA